MKLRDLFKSGKTRSRALPEEFSTGKPASGQSGKEREVLEIERLTEGKVKGDLARQLYTHGRQRLEDELQAGTDHHLQALLREAGDRIDLDIARRLYYLLIHDHMEAEGMQSDYLLWLKTEIGLREDAATGDRLLHGFGEFGYAPTNPVPVQGIVSEKIYLARLRDLKGRAWSWKRTGKTKVPNFDSFIHIYQGESPDGQRTERLFLYPIHRQSSRQAPGGFRLRESA